MANICMLHVQFFFTFLAPPPISPPLLPLSPPPPKKIDAGATTVRLKLRQNLFELLELKITKFCAKFLILE